MHRRSGQGPHATRARRAGKETTFRYPFDFKARTVAAPVTNDAPIAPRRRPRRRNAYAELLRDTRGLRREQQQAREAWFARLAADKKDETLFELEILLKGLACFANPRNHPGAGRRQTIVSLDFREHLVHARDGDGAHRRSSRARCSATRIAPSSSSATWRRCCPRTSPARKLLHAAMAQETPEGSLFVLRHGFTNLIEVAGGLLRLHAPALPALLRAPRHGDARDRAERVLQPALARSSSAPSSIASPRRRCSS